MGLTSILTGGLAKTVGDTAGRIVESKDLTTRAKVEASSAVDQAMIENAGAINAGRSTWRPKWMNSIRHLLAAGFVISFVGLGAMFFALIAIFVGWAEYQQWARIQSDVEWLLIEWVKLMASLISVATWSFLGYSPFRSLSQIASNGDESSIVTRAIKRVMPKAAAPVVTREAMQAPAEIERIAGVVLPGSQEINPEPEVEPLDIKRLGSTLQRHEGVVYEIYPDSKGHRTAGVGHLLTKADLEFNFPLKTAISRERVKEWFHQDLAAAISDARSVVSDFDQLPQDARQVLCNMAFQMGRSGLQDFKKTIPLIEQGRWLDASVEMLDSQWFREDSPGRAKELSDVIKALAS